MNNYWTYCGRILMDFYYAANLLVILPTQVSRMMLNWKIFGFLGPHLIPESTSARQDVSIYTRLRYFFASGLFSAWFSDWPPFVEIAIDRLVYYHAPYSISISHIAPSRPMLFLYLNQYRVIACARQQPAPIQFLSLQSCFAI